MQLFCGDCSTLLASINKQTSSWKPKKRRQTKAEDVDTFQTGLGYKIICQAFNTTP